MKKSLKITVVAVSALVLIAVVISFLVIPLAGKSAMLHPAHEPMYVIPDDFGMTFHPVTIPTEDGLNLSGWLIDPKDPESPKAGITLIVFHGATHSKAFVLDHYGKGFYDLGYRLLFVDSRGRGESPDTEAGLTWGIEEQKDAAAAVDFVESLPDPYHGKIVLFGESQGAAMVLFFAASPDGDRADVVIADSSWAYGDKMIRDAYPVRAGFPWFPFGLVTVKMMEKHYGYPFADISPAEAASRIRIPVFLIHGAEDSNFGPENSEEIFRHLDKSVKKSLWIVPGADHVQGYLDPDYFQKIDLFLLSVSPE